MTTDIERADATFVEALQLYQDRIGPALKRAGVIPKTEPRVFLMACAIQFAAAANAFDLTDVEAQDLLDAVQAKYRLMTAAVLGTRPS